MTHSQAQERLAMVANMIPDISAHLEIGEDETADAILSAMAYLNSILSAFKADKIDYLA